MQAGPGLLPGSPSWKKAHRLEHLPNTSDHLWHHIQSSPSPLALPLTKLPLLSPSWSTQNPKAIKLQENVIFFQISCPSACPVFDLVSVSGGDTHPPPPLLSASSIPFCSLSLLSEVNGFIGQTQTRGSSETLSGHLS